MLAKRLLSSMMTGGGTIMIQQKLLMTESSMESEESRMFTSTTSTEYLGTMGKAARVGTPCLNGWGHLRLVRGEASWSADWIRLWRCLCRACETSQLIRSVRIRMFDLP